MPTLLISSTNYNGQYGDITFFPDTGGTFNLGYQLIPYYYVADYVYGNYDVFFSAFNKTCSFNLTSSGVTPTPTVTVTVTPTTTVTPTITSTPTTTVTPTITPSITPTTTVTPSPTATPISLTTYYGTWSQYSPLGTQQCSATLSALTISTATTLNGIGIVVSNLDGTPINSLKIISSDIIDTYNANTNSSSVVSSIGGCDSQPIPTVCGSDQFTITNNTGSPITVDNVTSPFTNVSLSQFTLSAFTNLIVCSCTTPTTSGGLVTNNGACPYL